MLELAGRTPQPEPRIWRTQWYGAQPDGGYDCLIGEKMWQFFMENYREW